MHIPQHTFLVTGGSSGLGAACVRRLAAQGGNVVIADLNDTAGQALAQELGRSAVFARTDVTDDVSVEQAVAVALKEFGGLHGVVQCAGIVHGEKVLGKDKPHALAVFAKIVGVNLVGTFNVLRLAAAAMAGNAPTAGGERGVIVNTASVAAFDGQIGQAGYAASKGGVVSLTLPTARELARHGIRVMAIAPGIFDTPMLAGLPEPVRVSLGQQIPFPPRLGRPDEFAALAQHIIENEMLNGTVIRLDGAIRMAAK
ncbi:MAG: SDR family NAD(P)-dependent oxidoreductase [Gemmataceae bacterium]|nr:SDR family NAD(P)-dependent oxidoreductase [Gemmataceae bacterium]